MNPPHSCNSFRSSFLYFFFTVLVGALVASSCQAPKPPAGPSSQYQDAQSAFKSGDYDHVLEATEAMAASSATGPYAERARVLRSIIFSARIRSSLQLTDAYAAAEKSNRNSNVKMRFEQLRQDSATSAAHAALDLGQTVHDLLKSSSPPQEFTLDVPYPSVEGPAEIPQLDRVRQGIWIDPDVQAATAQAARRKAVDDVLSEALGGDRDKARAALSSGSAKISGFDFTLFLAHQLINGARALDRFHDNDPQQFKMIANEAEQTAKLAEGYLKGKHDKPKEEEFKKLMEQLKKEKHTMNM